MDDDGDEEARRRWRTHALEGEKKRYCCSSAAASDSIYGFGVDGQGVAAPGGKASRDGAAADEGGGAGSRNLKL